MGFFIDRSALVENEMRFLSFKRCSDFIYYYLFTLLSSTCWEAKAWIILAAWCSYHLKIVLSFIDRFFRFINQPWNKLDESSKLEQLDSSQVLNKNYTWKKKIQVHFYILIMDEKVLVLCEKWLSKVFHQIFTFWDPLSKKKWFLRKCLSVCLSVGRVRHNSR